MKNILCQTCKNIVGIIDENALVSSFDQFVGIEIYCKNCKKQRIGPYFKDENQLLYQEGD